MDDGHLNYVNQGLQGCRIVNQKLMPLITNPVDYREVGQAESFANRGAVIHTMIE